MQPTTTRYAQSGGVSIAYQVVGEGGLDLVLVPGWISHVEFMWEQPLVARFLSRLASFSRLIIFDKRGTGLSDRVAELPTLEQRMDDVRAVMDASGSEGAALLGMSEGGPMSALFAATYPDRTSALVLYGAMAKTIWSEDHPFGADPEVVRHSREGIEHYWGTGISSEVFAPSVADDERFRDWWARFERQGASPGAMRALFEMYAEIDVRHVLPAIRVPTLVLHRRGDRAVNWRASRYIADRVPGARFVLLPGIDHFSPAGDADALLDEIEEFLTGARHGPEIDRVLATVMFTDIVESTRRAAELGDRRWRDLLDAHHRLVRRELERYRGREVKTMGDGFLATFDGPARGIRCGSAICEGVRTLGIDVRTGLHTGECELIGGDVGGIAVHIAARVAAEAGPGEVLVSSTVKDLVAGSGIRFAERGTHRLKGVPDEWRLFAVAGA